MGLTIKTGEAANPTGNKVVVGRRLWLTASGQVVEDGDPRASTLFCGPGKAVLRSELADHGVTIGEPKAEAKEAEPAANKEDAEGEDKSEKPKPKATKKKTRRKAAGKK